MEKALYLEIVSTEKVLFCGNISMVEMPGKRGRFSIMKDHAPIISSLIDGPIRVVPFKKEEEEQMFDCQSGYVECSDNKISILLNA